MIEDRPARLESTTEEESKTPADHVVEGLEVPAAPKLDKHASGPDNSIDMVRTKARPAPLHPLHI